MKIRNPKKGQILVITLIIMFILSLVSLSAAIGINRETQQRVYNEVYEQNYANAESRLLQAAELIKGLGGLRPGDLSAFQLGFEKFSDLTTNFNVQCSEEQLGEFECVVVEDCIETTLNLSPSNSIDSVPLKTSDAIHIDLVNPSGQLYVDNLNFSWTEEVSWSISLVTKRQYGPDSKNYEYELIKGQYIGPGIIRDNILPYSNMSSNSFTLGNLKALLGHGTAVNYIQTSKMGQVPCPTCNPEAPVFLRLRPLITNGSSVTSLSVVGSSNFSAQSIDLAAQSKNVCINDTSPTPLLSLNLPLISAPPALFDYVFYEK